MASSASWRPRKSGWIAIPPTCAIRLRTFRPLPEQRAGAVAVQLDDEQAALLRVALELLGDPVSLVAAAGSQERAHILVGVEAGQEVEVVGLGGTE